jgi:hypothetical protein
VIALPIAGAVWAAGAGLPAAAATCPPPTGDPYAQAGLADAPAAYYRLDESPGQALCDASTHALHGTYAGTGISYLQPGALNSTADPAIVTDGSVQPAHSTANSVVSGSVNFSLEGWFKTTTRQDQMVVSIGQAGNQNMAGIGVWSNQCSGTGGNLDLIMFDTFGGAFGFDASAVGVNVFDGKWHHTAASFNASGGGTVTAYVDGQSLGTATVADHPSASPVRVGFWIDTVCNQPWKGGLDEVAVYPSALSAARVSAHYAAGIQAAATTSPTTTASPAVATTASPAVTTASPAAGLPSTGTGPDRSQVELWLLLPAGLALLGGGTALLRGRGKPRDKL